MPPQGQDTPQPTPTPTPPQDTPPQAPQTPPPTTPPSFNPTATPPQQPTTPAAGPSFTPPQHGVMPNTPAGGHPKKSPALLISIVAGAVVLIGGAVLAYFLLFTGIALETYDGDKYSLKVPTGYTKEEESGSVIFTEPGPKSSASTVFAYYSEFPGSPTQAQVDAAKSLYKSQLESRISGYTSGGQSLENLKIEDTTYKGQEAILATAKTKADGTEGIVKVITVIDSDKIFIVGVVTHGADTGLTAKADEIINSFTPK